MLYMYKVDTRNAYECEKYSHENLESKCANSFNSRRTFDSKSQFIEFFFCSLSITKYGWKYSYMQ